LVITQNDYNIYILYVRTGDITQSLSVAWSVSEVLSIDT